MPSQRIAQRFVALAALLLANALHAERSEPSPKTAEITKVTADMKAASLILRGGQVFSNYCLPCHPADSSMLPISQSPLIQGASVELVRFILFSKGNSQHPAWHVMLSPNDVANLSTYMQAQFKRSNLEPVSTATVVSVIAAKYREGDSACNAVK
jgi:mono/diheme cytochrome c family protein